MPDDDDMTVLLHMSRSDALSVADLLILHGNENDHNIAANIHYKVEQAEQAAAKEGD